MNGAKNGPLARKRADGVRCVRCGLAGIFVMLKGRSRHNRSVSALTAYGVTPRHGRMCVHRGVVVGVGPVISRDTRAVVCGCRVEECAVLAGVSFSGNVCDAWWCLGW